MVAADHQQEQHQELGRLEVAMGSGRAALLEGDFPEAALRGQMQLHVNVKSKRFSAASACLCDHETCDNKVSEWFKLMCRVSLLSSKSNGT